MASFLFFVLFLVVFFFGGLVGFLFVFWVVMLRAIECWRVTGADCWRVPTETFRGFILFREKEIERERERGRERRERDVAPSGAWVVRVWCLFLTPPPCTLSRLSLPPSLSPSPLALPCSPPYFLCPRKREFLVCARAHPPLRDHHIQSQNLTYFSSPPIKKRSSLCLTKPCSLRWN